MILLKQLVKTDFKLRYQGSVLGYVWSLLRPLFMFVVLYFVFTVFLPVGRNIPFKAVYLLVGIVLWNYFSEITTGSIGAVVGKGDLLRKINFPKYLIVFAVVISAVINLLLNTIVILVFMVATGVPFTVNIIWVPFLIIEITILALGIAFLLSAAFVRYRDVTYIWDVVMQAGFYATPILYPISEVALRYPKIAEAMMLSPIAQVIQDTRWATITTTTITTHKTFNGETLMTLLPILISMLILVVGIMYFKKRSKFFAEEI